MPLLDLVEYFNQRICEEQGLNQAPLELRSGRAVGNFGGMRLTTEFHPVRRSDALSIVSGHDAGLQAFQPDDHPTNPERFFQATDVASVINLDRLCRTIHMLNFLPGTHEEGCLFLAVHPRHVLAVKKDHGVYFEEIIFRCGLSPKRVIITVPVVPMYGQELLLLFEGLKNYRLRGYGTAIRLEGPPIRERWVERYFIEFLHRMTPDFVRMDVNSFADSWVDVDHIRAKNSLLSVVQSLDTQFLMEGIETPRQLNLALQLQAELLSGSYLEKPENRGLQRA